MSWLGRYALRKLLDENQRQHLPFPVRTAPPENMKDLINVRRQFGTILIDPPWRFLHCTGKVSPEHKRLRRYSTMSFAEIAALPIDRLALPQCHLYLWSPNALLPEAL